jgi:serine/threonine protein kinase
MSSAVSKQPGAISKEAGAISKESGAISKESGAVSKSAGVAIPETVGPAGDALEDPRVVALVQEYLALAEQGKSPNRNDYVNRYPELAVAVQQCLDGLDLVRAEAPNSSGSAEQRAELAGTAAADFPASPLGDFQIVRELARGGMGIVYEAVQLSLGRRVALKVLPFAATLDARHLQRFKTEAQAAALLHHPNIVPVYAVGCERGVHFYAMQLIEGQSLAALILQLRRQAGLPSPEEGHSSSSVHSSYILGGGTQTASDSSAASRGGRPLPGTAKPPLPDTLSKFQAQLSTQHAGRDNRFFQTAARLMLQAAQALEHAHELGIVHRDIKPANLLLEVHGTLWVTDFGLAQFHSDAGLTRTGDIPGTIRYMSPEQASGLKTLDHRTDVYSLGATFYEVLTLEPIFYGRDAQYLLNQVLHAEPRALRQRDKTIPVELETIILKAVSKNPFDRYRTAGDLAADLQRFLDHKPILARRPTLLDRARKWSRRHPSVVAATFIVLAGLAIGISVSNHRDKLREQERANEEKLRANEEKLRANEAERRFRQARDAVDVMIEVSEDELADNMGAQSTRRRLLGIALGYYEGFVEERRGDTAGQGELLAVQERVKRILYELNLLRRGLDVDVLKEPKVQEALQVDSEQQARLTSLFQKWNEERGTLFVSLPTLDEDARHRKFVSIAKEHDEALGLVLSSRQRERLRQIALQSLGLQAFREAEVIEALDLTAEQRATIRKISQELTARLRSDSWRGGPPPGERDFRSADEARRKRYSAAVEEAVAAAESFLQPDQLAEWRTLTGEPFPGAAGLLDQRGGRFGGMRGQRGPRTGSPPGEGGPGPDGSPPPGKRRGGTEAAPPAG